MNFLGHARLAARRDADPRYVLGAMLPDLASMARARVRGVREARVDAGVRFHHATDEAFHGAPTFVRWLREGVPELESAGIGRGAARAVAHVGAELLLDGWLVEEEGLPPAFDAGIAAAHALAPAIDWEAGPRGGSLAEVCERLAAADLPADYRRPERVAWRLERLLAPRPRLAIAAGERPAVERWCAAFRERLPADAPRLLAEVDATLLSYDRALRRIS